MTTTCITKSRLPQSGKRQENAILMSGKSRGILYRGEIYKYLFKINEKSVK